MSSIYDVRLSQDEIAFVLFGRLVVTAVKFENILKVREIAPLAPGPLFAYNFKSRLLARTFLLVLRRGWFARKILITPAHPDYLTKLLHQHNVTFEQSRFVKQVGPLRPPT